MRACLSVSSCCFLHANGREQASCALSETTKCQGRASTSGEEPQTLPDATEVVHWVD